MNWFKEHEEDLTRVDRYKFNGDIKQTDLFVGEGMRERRIAEEVTKYDMSGRPYVEVWVDGKMVESYYI